MNDIKAGIFLTDYFTMAIWKSQDWHVDKSLTYLCICDILVYQSVDWIYNKRAGLSLFNNRKINV